MPTFTNWFHNQHVNLESAIHSLQCQQDITFRFEIEGEEKDSPVYLLPIETYGSLVCGMFLIDNEPREVALGFKHTRKLFKTEYYDLDSLHDGFSLIPTPSNHRLYLPLQLTKSACKKFSGDARWPGPLRTYGVKGAEHDYPLYLLAYTDEGPTIRGFCKSQDEHLLTFTQYTNEEGNKKLKEFLNSFWSNPTKRPKAHKNSSKNMQTEQGSIDWHDPKSIVAYLDREIIKQDGAKKAAAVIFSNYIIRKETGADDLPNESLLLMGPTGSGKTMIFKKLAQKADLPFAKASLTGKSTEGYVGHNLSDVFKLIVEQTEGDAPYGIVFLDEIDKVANRSNRGFDFGPRIQDEIIGWIEGDKVRVKYYEDSGRKESWLDTKNLLFVMAGAFSGTEGNSLEDIIRTRMGGKRQIGFAAQTETMTEQSLLSYVKPEDLIIYGLKPEIVGRITTKAVLDYLTEEDKVRILKESEDSVLIKYTNLLSSRGYSLKIDEDALRVIVNNCPKETGARELNTACSNLFVELLYDCERYVKNNEVYITTELAKEILEAKRRTK